MKYHTYEMTDAEWREATRKQMHEDYDSTAKDTVLTLILAFEALLRNRIDGTYIDIPDEWTEDKLGFYIEVLEEIWSDKHEAEVMIRRYTEVSNGQ